MARRRSSSGPTRLSRFRRWVDQGGNRLDGVLADELVEDARPDLVESMDEMHYRLSERERREIEVEAAMQDRLRAWSDSRGAKIIGRAYSLIAIVLCLGIIYVLLLTVSDLPPFGQFDTPHNNEVMRRYVEKGMEETGAVNIISGMILDYRAFDTLGESHVLFIAMCCVIGLLRIDHKNPAERRSALVNDRQFEPKNDIILQRITNLLVPIILVFGVYILFNGHISPGGGFSGGAIIGAGMILYLNAFGFEKTEKFLNMSVVKVVSCCALGFYAFSKCYSFFMGANGFESHISTGTPGDLFSAGLILPLNIAVGLVVACTMYTFYALFRKGDL